MRLKNINRRKLNNKGFTLIELLAVVVILAIVMGIAATSVLSSINNSRSSTLLSTAQNAANQLNTWASEDALATEIGNMHIGTDSKFYEEVVSGNSGANAGKWVCLNDTLKVNNGGSKVGILTALGLKGAADGATGDNKGDIVVGDSEPTVNDGTAAGSKAGTTATRGTCSAVRYNTKIGAYEILLTANKQGKYYVAKDGETKNYAFSRASAYATQIGD